MVFYAHKNHQKQQTGYFLLYTSHFALSHHFNPSASYESREVSHHKQSLIKHRVHAHSFKAYIVTMSIVYILMFYICAQKCKYIYINLHPCQNWLPKRPDNRWYSNYLWLVGRSQPPSREFSGWNILIRQPLPPNHRPKLPLILFCAKNDDLEYWPAQPSIGKLTAVITLWHSEAAWSKRAGSLFTHQWLFATHPPWSLSRLIAIYRNFMKWANYPQVATELTTHCASSASKQ